MASTGVNVRTNQKIKEQDINSKLQLYGIYEGSSRPLKAESRAASAQAETNECRD